MAISDKRFRELPGPRPRPVRPLEVFPRKGRVPKYENPAQTDFTSSGKQLVKDIPNPADMKLDPRAPGKLRVLILPKCTIKGTPETDFEKLENSLGDYWVHVTGKRFGAITNTAAAQVLSLDAQGNAALERGPGEYLRLYLKHYM